MNPRSVATVTLALACGLLGNSGTSSRLPAAQLADPATPHDGLVDELDFCRDGSGSAPRRAPVFGHRGDGWPRTLEGTGIIRELVPGYCGFACLASQVRIEIVRTSRRYRAGELFAYAYCVQPDDVEEYCNHLVRFRARKIVSDEDLCGVTDSFDSAGVPFYVIDNFHTDVIPLDGDNEPTVQASNTPVKLSVHAVTGRAYARPAPARPAAYGRR